MKRIFATSVILLLASNVWAQQAPGPVDFTKVFTPNTIGPGSISTVQFTISNTAASPVTGLTFSDVLPAVPDDLLIATPALASTSCTDGVVTAVSGTNTISFSNGQLGAGSACTVSVNVTAATPGNYTNPAVQLSYDGLTVTAPSTTPIDLTVDGSAPGFSKSFMPGTVSLGGRSTLTFTIDNSMNPTYVANLDFTDNLPAGMVVADPPNATTNCGNPLIPANLTAVAGTSSIMLDSNGNFQFPALAAGATCTVVVDVEANSVGILNNVTSDLLADFVGVGFAGDDLEVTVTPLAIQKSFLDDPVAAGGQVTLEFAIENYDRGLSASQIAFTDDLSSLVPSLSGITFDSEVSNTCGGTLTGVSTDLITFSGGSLAAASSCSIQVKLNVPGGPVTGSYINTSSAVTAMLGGVQITGNSASDTLFINNAPLLVKEFLEAGTGASDPVVNPGDSVVLQFTVTNSSITSAATDITFLDELTDGSGGSPPDLTTGFLPFPVNVTLPPQPNPPCGQGSSLSLVIINTGRQGLQLDNGNLGPDASCTFEVTLEIPADMTAGTYLNTTEMPSATVDGATATGEPASDSLIINAAPRLTKAFTDDPVVPGGSVTLEFSLGHPVEAATDATDIEFTDDLAPVLSGLIATGLPLTQACDPDGPGGTAGTGTLSGSAGDTFLTFQDGTLAPGESCVISLTLNVPANAVVGNYANTTSEVSATVSGLATSSLAASDDLQVAGLEFTKQFLKNPVIAGDTSTLRFTIDNIHPITDADITFFTDALTNVIPGLAATGPASVNTCGGNLSGTTFLTYVGGSVFSGQSCTIEVEVLIPPATASSSYTNVTSSLMAVQGGTVSINPAVDTLDVNSDLLQLRKSFSPASVVPGDSVGLAFTLMNLDTNNPASDIGFSDDLAAVLSGLTVDSQVSDNCGGSLAGVGTDMLSYSAGTLAPAATCTIEVLLDVPANAAEGTYTNITSSVDGTITGLPVFGDPASADLELFMPLGFSKAFAGPSAAGGTAILTFSITNPRTSAADGLSFTDDLNAFFPGMIASSLPATPCGAQSVISGSSFVSFKGGEVASNGGVCSFDIEVLVPPTASPGVYSNTTSGLFANGLSAGDPATADLVIVPPPVFTKVFTPDTIDAGDNSTLVFTIDNSASSLAANSLEFTDNLPAGLVIATPASGLNTCSGTLSAMDGGPVISLVGGSVQAGSSCSISVDTTSVAGGQFVNTTGDLTSSSGNSGTASDTLTVNAVADLSISKTDGVTDAIPGQSVTYTIIAANSGPSEDPAATITDAFPAGLTCSYTSTAAGGASGNTAAGSGNLAESVSMPSGSSVTYIATCDIDVTASGTLINSASIVSSVTDPDNSNNIAVDDDTVLGAQADLSITKTDGVTSADPGDTITYTIVASNSGPSEDPSASLVDTFPAELTCTFTSVAAGGATGNTAAGSGDINDILMMPSGSSVTYTAACVIDQSFTGVLSNTASITASVTDPDNSNNMATDNDTSVNAVADLAISKTDGVITAIPGESVTYTIVASNNGPSDDPSVSVSDVFASELVCSYTSVAAGGASGNTAAGSGNIAESLSMPSGSAVTYTAVCDIDSAASGTLSNTATISGVAPDPDAGNNSATDNDTVLTATADLTITKSDGVTSAIPGDSITYTIVASNNGPSDEPSASVNDTFSTDLTCSYTSVAAGGASGNTAAGSGDIAETLIMPSGSTVTYTADCAIDMAATGTLSNTATIGASVTDPDTSNNTATDDDTVLDAQADVAVSMTTSSATISPGQTLTYAIVVENSGPSDDPLVTVTDMFPADLTCTYTSVSTGGATGNSLTGSGDISDSLSMPAGSSVTYTADCSVAATASGNVANTVTISSSITDPDSPNNSATNITAIVALQVTEPIPTISDRIMLLLIVLFAGFGGVRLRQIRGSL